MADYSISQLTTDATAADTDLVEVAKDNGDGTYSSKKQTRSTHHAGLATSATVSAHTGNTSNPHSVTKTQVGLGNIDNTADANKPVSTATQAALDAKASVTSLNAHIADTANPHAVTKAQVGLANVPNTDATARANHTGTQSADTITDGTTNKAFTATLKTKLDGIEAGAEANHVDSVNGQTGAVTLDIDDVAPTQTGNSGKVLTTDGTNATWQAVAAGDSLPDQTGNSGKYLTTDGTDPSWATLDGGGDMAAATYDPNNVAADAFAMDNMVEGTTTKILTATERTKLAGIESGATADQTGAEIKSAYEAEADTNAYTDAEKTKLAGIASGAEVNVQADWDAVSGDAQILNKPTLGTAAAADTGDFATAAQGATADSALQDVVEDTTPQLGGDLDANGHKLTFNSGQYELLASATFDGFYAYDSIGGSTNFVFPEGFYIGANTDTDASGNWEPALIAGVDGTLTAANNSQGTAGNRYFRVDMTDGLQLKTAGLAFRSSLKSDNLTADRDFQLPDAAGTIATEGYVDTAVAGAGGMSDLVDDTTPQLGGNLDLNTHTVGDASAADLTKLSEVTATSTELNYVDGVTSAIQTQLDAKAPLASPTFTGTVTLPSGQALIAPALGTPASGTMTNVTGLPEGGLSLTDITTNNVSTTKHGFAPKAPNDATKYLDGTGAWSTPAGGGGGSSTPQGTIYLDYTHTGAVTEFVTGTGTLTYGTLYLNLQSGATSGGKAQVWLQRGSAAPAFSPTSFKNVKGNAWLTFTGGGGDGTSFLQFFSTSTTPSATLKQMGIRETKVGGTFTVYTSTGDGTTETANAISGWSVDGNARQYSAVLTESTNVKFYLDGTLTSTHTTNLPPSSSTDYRTYQSVAYCDCSSANNHQLRLHGFSLNWDLY